MKKIVLSISIPLIIAITLFTCKQQEEKKEKQADTSLDESAVAVSLVPVEKVNIAIPVVASGLVNTKNESRLSFKIGGIVKRIYVEEGQSVQKGQLLATLDLTEIEAQVSQAKNNVDKLKRDLERVQRLFADSAATLEMVQNLQTAYDVALQSKSIAEFNREYATIKASNSGKVLKKFLNEGELAGPGAPVFYLNSAGQNEWIINLALPDVDWARLQLRDKCKIEIDAFPGQTLEGSVSLIGEGADPFTSLYPIEVSIAKTNLRLASGLFASVEITPAKSLALARIPIEALVEGSGKRAFVYTLQSDQRKVNKVEVSVSHIKDGNAFISKGLEEVGSVITSGSGFLTESSIVTVAQNK
jgi:membrane fusion protein, multidrug efflux system